MGCVLYERETKRESERERSTHADCLTRVRACFLLARVRTPSSQVRQKERERERERERKREGESVKEGER